MKTKKSNKRNTAIFYAILSQMPGYNKAFQKECKEIEVSDYMIGKYGKCESTSLSALSDTDYNELINAMRVRLAGISSKNTLIDQIERKKMINQILRAFTIIGVNVIDSDYTLVNDHIRKLPLSKGRIIPQFKTAELPALLGAVRGYTDAIKKRQQKERQLSKMN